MIRLDHFYCRHVLYMKNHEIYFPIQSSMELEKAFSLVVWPQMEPNIEFLKWQNEAVEDELWDMTHMRDAICLKLEFLKLFLLVQDIKGWIMDHLCCDCICLEPLRIWLYIDDRWYSEEFPSSLEILVL